MKALVLKEDKELVIEELDRPQPKAGEVLVKLYAAALNHREIWISKGLYPGMKLPCILGADGSGVVEQVGDKVDEELINKEVIIYPAYDWGNDDIAPLRSFRVLGMPDPGTIAEYIVVPKDHLFEKPEYLSFEEAAALPVAYLTAWRGLTRHGKIGEGKSVLITGIGGGVAQAGLSFATAFGASPYVTSSKEDKITDAITHGAKGGVNYKDEDWNLQLKTISGGIDIVLDSSPSANLDDYYKFMNYGGRIVAYGSTGSRKTTINISKFFLRHIQFIGTAMGSPREMKAMLVFMEQHQIKPRIHATYDLNQSIQAIQALAEGIQMGKIVINLNA